MSAAAFAKTVRDYAELAAQNMGVTLTTAQIDSIGLAAYSAFIDAQVREKNCHHNWSRRRDGRFCHLCGRIEFGVAA